MVLPVIKVRGPAGSPVSLYTAEFRNMVEAAESYLAGDRDFMDLYYVIAEAWHAVRLYGPDRTVAPIIREWSEMSGRCRNEWRMAPNPISEEQFRSWLVRQL